MLSRLTSSRLPLRRIETQVQDAALKSVLSRRGLFKLGAGVCAAVVVASAFSLRSLLADRPAGSTRSVFDDDESLTILAIADAYFPAGNVLKFSASSVDVVGGVDAYASRLLPRERKLLRVLLRAVDQWPRLSFTSTARFRDLDLDRRKLVLQAFEDSPLATRRLLATVLRSLIAMPLFDDPRLLSALGHRHGCGLPILEG